MSYALALSAISGITGLASGIRDSNRSNNLNKRALQLQEEELQFAKDRLARFNQIYGPIEHNLGDFFQRLTPEFFASRGLTAFEQQLQKSQEKLDNFFVQNDIDTGVRIDVKAKSEIEAAKTRAGIVADAPIKVAEAQQGFLNLGINREQNAVAQRSGAATNISNLLTNQANEAIRSADIGFGAAGTAFANVAEELDASSGRPEID